MTRSNSLEIVCNKDIGQKLIRLQLSPFLIKQWLYFGNRQCIWENPRF